ncbi:MAG TPA: HDOD domain-containing protein [Kofleriaceae bacterium]|nr:HDOD domain-containing protein [Kofleriaceae bacterium]
MTTPIPTPTRRILFVDDDPQLLSGLGKALRKHRHRWTMVFADSGDAALAEIHRATFDVVVSDMRMPVMDGAELLAQIRDRDPSTIRMILSGFSERSAIVRAQPVAHQFINKPCQISDLSMAIDRACELREIFGRPALRAVIGALGAVPPAPAAYHELAAMIGCADPNDEAMAAVVERDPTLRARVLELASSPVLGADSEVRSIGEAASQLGIETVAGLALAAHAFALAGDRPLAELSLPSLPQHSLAIAATARDRATTGEAAADAFIAGLVHDLGKLVIAVALPGAHAAIMDQLAHPGGGHRAVEQRVLGTSHAEIGAYLLGLWGLPLPIIDAIAHHDDDTVAATPVLAALRDAHRAMAPAAR